MYIMYMYYILDDFVKIEQVFIYADVWTRLPL